MQVIDTVGATPLAELATGVDAPGIRLLGKLEGNNPTGSVKDRAARGMILGAESRGLLQPGVRMIEPTSGNTGIALAMVAAARGYAIEIVMPEDATKERVQLMRAYGAVVTLTPAAKGMEGAIDYAREKAEREGMIMLDQFANPDNPHAHYVSTGPEIFRATDGAITHFVSAMGTTGTIMGVSRYLKEQNADIQIVGCQPDPGSQIPGIRAWPEAYLPKVFERERVDRIVEVAQADAERTARALAQEEGVLSGPSSGGAVWVARQVCKELADAGREGTVVAIICDRGERYVSSGLFYETEEGEA